jgi:hypothetical protein
MTPRIQRCVAILSVAAGRAAQGQLRIPTPAAAPTTPAECQKVADDWRRSQLEPLSAAIRSATAEKRDSVFKAYRVRSDLVFPAVRAWTIECARKFEVDRMPSSGQLIDLMRLDMFIPDTAGFWRAAQRTLAANDLTPRMRADALVDEADMSMTFRGDATRWTERAERILREINALPDSLANRKLHPNAAIVAVYEGLGLTAAAAAHAPTLISLGRQLRDRQVMQLGYESLARAAADRLQADSATELLRAAERDAGPEDRLVQMRRRYALIGTKAAPIAGRWWLNSPNTTAPVQPGDGKVHLIEFTAHFCTRCPSTYPPLRAIADRMRGRDFDIVLVTETYGFSKSGLLVSADDEIAADRAYYERDVPFRVAITPRGSGGMSSPLADAYEVGSQRAILSNVPEVVVLDRRGIIRAIVSGFEEGGEARISQLIEKLLAEKR